MARRRKFNGIGACLQFLSCVAAPALADFPRFTVHRIDTFGTALGQTALADVDRDGDLDWIAGNAAHAPQLPGAIFWWEYRVVRTSARRHGMRTPAEEIRGASTATSIWRSNMLKESAAAGAERGG